MKKIILKEKFIEKRWITEAIECDMCGSFCPDPEFGRWESANGSGNVYTKLESSTIYGDDTIDTEVDLCPECADWLLIMIQEGKLNRPDDFEKFAFRAKLRSLK